MHPEARQRRRKPPDLLPAKLEKSGDAEIQPLAGESSRGLRVRGERTWKDGSMPGRERLRAETIRGEAVLRKRR